MFRWWLGQGHLGGGLSGGSGWAGFARWCRRCRPGAPVSSRLGRRPIRRDPAGGCRRLGAALGSVLVARVPGVVGWDEGSFALAGARAQPRRVLRSWWKLHSGSSSSSRVCLVCAQGSRWSHSTRARWQPCDRAGGVHPQQRGLCAAVGPRPRWVTLSTSTPSVMTSFTIASPRALWRPTPGSGRPRRSRTVPHPARGHGATPPRPPAAVPDNADWSTPAPRTPTPHCQRRRPSQRRRCLDLRRRHARRAASRHQRPRVQRAPSTLPPTGLQPGRPNGARRRCAPFRRSGGARPDVGLAGSAVAFLLLQCRRRVRLVDQGVEGVGLDWFVAARARAA